MSRANLIAVLAASLAGWVAFIVFGIPLFLRLFETQTFNLPGGSMIPTVMPGDQFVVSKTAYGPLSLPLGLSALARQTEAHEPVRGDLVAFRHPRSRVDYFKRLIGLPGERIQMRAGRLYINDVQVPRERIADFLYSEPSGYETRSAQFVETLPGGLQHRILEISDNGPLDNTDVFTVPAGHYFMLGDNRDNSLDSRVPVTAGGVGFVPFENLIGPVVDIRRGQGTASAGGTTK